MDFGREISVLLLLVYCIFKARSQSTDLEDFSTRESEYGPTVTTQTSIDESPSSHPDDFNWPNFIIAGVVSEDLVLIGHLSPTETWKEISSTQYIADSLSANAFRNIVCHYDHASLGIACTRNRAKFQLDIPRSYMHNLGYNLINLNPFGDHFIFQEVKSGGIWLLSLETGKAVLLIGQATMKTRYSSMEVDWDNGYLMLLGGNSLEVWTLEGHNRALVLQQIISTRNFGKTIRGLTIDSKTTTVYWIADDGIVKANYDVVNHVPRPQIIGEFEKRRLVWSLEYFNNSLFYASMDQFGPELYICRWDIRNRVEMERKKYSVPGTNANIQSLIVFEDVAGAGNRTNPCSKCSHICIPRHGAGYECTCPFGQRMLNATHCARPLEVRVIAEETSETSNRYLQTYDAMAKFEDSLVSSELLSTSVMIPQPEGYCTLDGPLLECFNFTGSMGTWSLKDPNVVRVLAITGERTLIWFNGTCVNAQSMSKPLGTLHCDPAIDSENVVLDHVNWHLFYRNISSRILVHVDLPERQSTVDSNIVDVDEFNVTKIPQPNGLAVNVENQNLFFFTACWLFGLSYNPMLEKAHLTAPVSLFDLADQRNFSQKLLRYSSGFLYWVEIQPSRQAIVRYDLRKRNLETLVQVARGFNVVFFDVSDDGIKSHFQQDCASANGCSHFCRKSVYSLVCWCPLGLFVIGKDRDCIQLEYDSELLETIIGLAVLLGIIVMTNCIGFAIYKRYNNSRIRRLIEAFKHGELDLNDPTVDADDPNQAQLLPFERILDPNVLKVHRSKSLGSGHFGEVCEGEYEGRKVSVKTLKGRLDFDTLKSFLGELKIMAFVGQHENIVQLVGAYMSRIHYFGKIYAVIEFATNGSLDGHLKKYRNRAHASRASAGETRETSLSVPAETLLDNNAEFIQLFCDWSQQISRAMSFLTSRRVIHGDLATRNVLVFDDNILKVTDFGQSHNLYQSSIYVSRNKARPLPWAWTPPEVFEDQQFSPQSDVWSYGVTLWEIFEFGKLPKPEVMPQEVYNGVVLRCFETDPEARIDFATIEHFWIQYFGPEDELRHYVNVLL